MNTKNNGKIAIGILIMFVVALSIIGVTYAYFVSTFNDNEDREDVEVTAGRLVATYTNSKNLVATNVVPGWISDGLHYYDADESAKNNNQVFASKTDYNYIDDETLDADNIAETARLGRQEPLAFKVENTSDGDHTINYIIRLTVTANGIYNRWKTLYESKDEGTEAERAEKAIELEALVKDRDRLYVALYELPGDQQYSISNDGLSDYESNLIAGPFVLGDALTTQILTVGAPHSLDKGESKQYFVVFGYENTDSQQFATGLTIGAKVDVIGVSQDNSALTSDTTDDITYASVVDGTNALFTAKDLLVADINGDISDNDDDDNTTAERTAQQSYFADIKKAYGSQIVWYDSDNKPVVFAIDSNTADKATAATRTYSSGYVVGTDNSPMVEMASMPQDNAPIAQKTTTVVAGG